MRKSDDGQWDLTVEELALSCYQAYCAALGQTFDPDGLSGDERDRWGRTCRQALLWLPGYDGRPAVEAANRLRDEWAEGDEILKLHEAPALLAWEAVARHLNAILDSDDIRDVEALAESWREWANERRLHMPVVG